MNTPLQDAIRALACHPNSAETMVLDRDSAQLLSRLMGSVAELRKRVERSEPRRETLRDLFKVMETIDNHRI